MLAKEERRLYFMSESEVCHTEQCYKYKISMAVYKVHEVFYDGQIGFDVRAANCSVVMKAAS